MKKKELKLWNGRGVGASRGNTYIAAYSRAEAARMMESAFGGSAQSWANEIRVYYSNCGWGNTMSAINPTEPCIYTTAKSFTTEGLKKVYPPNS